MYFSTYRNLAYVGLVVGPFFLFGFFYLLTQSIGVAAVLAVLLGLVLVPLQLWQLSRMQDRLDDHDGSIPLSWAFDWDLVDDSPPDPSDPGLTPPVASSPSPAPLSSSQPARYCDSCGRASYAPGERFCPYCGAGLEATD